MTDISIHLSLYQSTCPSIYVCIHRRVAPVSNHKIMLSGLVFESWQNYELHELVWLAGRLFLGKARNPARKYFWFSCKEFIQWRPRWNVSNLRDEFLQRLKIIVSKSYSEWRLSRVSAVIPRSGVNLGLEHRRGSRGKTSQNQSGPVKSNQNQPEPARTRQSARINQNQPGPAKIEFWKCF